MTDKKEESRGIDGYTGEKAVSIRPITYKTKPMFREGIIAEFIYYEEVKDTVFGCS